MGSSRIKNIDKSKFPPGFFSDLAPTFNTRRASEGTISHNTLIAQKETVSSNFFKLRLHK